MTHSFWAPPVVTVLAGLTLLLAGAAPWVTTTDRRSVGGVVVAEPRDTPGTQFAPGAVAAGLAGLATGALMAVLRGRGRRACSLLVAGVGFVAAAIVVVGWSRGAAAPGEVTPAPFFAVTGAAGLIAAGVAGLRAPVRPPGASRYRVDDERPEDDEWSLAADDETQRRPG